MPMRQASRTPSTQPMFYERISFMQMHHAPRTPSPQPVCFEQKPQMGRSSSRGGDKTPRTLSPFSITRFAYCQEEHVGDVFGVGGYVMPLPQAKAMNGPSSQQPIPEVLAVQAMTAPFESQVPDMLAAQLPVMASPVQVMCLPGPPDKGRRWSDMEDEELLAASGDAPSEIPVPTENAINSSKGSIGHPLSCNEPCKYALKSRGCKDGADCDRCHLCKWKKPKTPLQVVHSSPKGKKYKSSELSR